LNTTNDSDIEGTATEYNFYLNDTKELLGARSCRMRGIVVPDFALVIIGIVRHASYDEIREVHNSCLHFEAKHIENRPLVVP